MALHTELTIPDTLLNEFKTCTRSHYNGKLEIETCTGHKFSFYYRLGRIVWASGGAHPLRRFRRNITQYCPQINLDTIQLQAGNRDIEYWDYQVLEALYNKQKIKREQVTQIICSTIGELLFDLTQQTSCHISACQRNKEVILEAPLSLSCTAISLEHIFQSWNSWSKVCAQIQRISNLAKIPIVILTDGNGLFDRMRAKVAGSTDFMTKPVVTDKVMDIVRKHLHVDTTSLYNSSIISKFEVSYV